MSACNSSCLTWPHGSTLPAWANLLGDRPGPQILGQPIEIPKFLNVRSPASRFFSLFLLPYFHCRHVGQGLALRRGQSELFSQVLHAPIFNSSFRFVFNAFPWVTALWAVPNICFHFFVSEMTFRCLLKNPLDAMEPKKIISSRRFCTRRSTSSTSSRLPPNAPFYSEKVHVFS